MTQTACGHITTVMGGTLRSSTATLGTTLVRFSGGPIVGEVRDYASEEGTGTAREHLPTASIVESAARELGKGFEIERRVSCAA